MHTTTLLAPYGRRSTANARGTVGAGHCGSTGSSRRGTVRADGGATYLCAATRYRPPQLVVDIANSTDTSGGSAPGLPPSGYGLAGMRERVLHLDGSFSIHSRPGAGTRIEVTLPLADEEPAEPQNEA